MRYYISSKTHCEIKFFSLHRTHEKNVSNESKECETKTVIGGCFKPKSLHLQIEIICVVKYRNRKCNTCNRRAIFAAAKTFYINKGKDLSTRCVIVRVCAGNEKKIFLFLIGNSCINIHTKLVRDDVRLEAHCIVSKLKTHFGAQLCTFYLPS